jgi:hypothetical protein
MRNTGHSCGAQDLPLEAGGARESLLGPIRMDEAMLNVTAAKPRAILGPIF